MKKIIASLTTLAILAGAFALTSETHGQQPASTSTKAHQVALIDMAEVFKEYDKFKALREELKVEVQKTDQEAKGKIEKLTKLQEQLKSGNLTEGSPEFSKLEGELAQGASELEAFRKVRQREFLRKESNIYKQVYLEVQDTVTQYAKHYDYTLVMRFNRGTVEDAANPQEVIQSMNRQVVYHRSDDDITTPILTYLNSQYQKSAGK